MELATQPDIYIPSIDENGNYIDKTPSFNNLKNGIRCPCGSRKDKTYDGISNFNAHIKTKIHKKWIEELNLNHEIYSDSRLLYLFKEVKGQRDTIITDAGEMNITFNTPKDVLLALIYSHTL